VRFRLDPKDADAPVPPPLRAAVPAQTAAAPVAAPAPTPSRWTKKRLLVVAAIALLLLGGGATAVLYATDSGPFAYPHAYLLEGSSVPRGLSLPDVPQDVRDEWGITTNPGQVPDDKLGQFEGTTRPTDAWIEVLQAGGRSDAVSVAALRFSDEDHANTFISQVSLRCAAGGFAILQDGRVVDLVIVGDSQAMPYYNAIVSALHAQASGLHGLCG
jgi:hypothetical protein